MPNLTGPIMLQKLNTYLGSLEDVREKQLRVLDEIRNQQHIVILFEHNGNNEARNTKRSSRKVYHLQL